MAGASEPVDVSTKRRRIAELARHSPEMGFTSLAYFIDIDWLREAYRRTRKDGPVGVDGQSGEDYAVDLESGRKRGRGENGDVALLRIGAQTRELVSAHGRPMVRDHPRRIRAGARQLVVVAEYPWPLLSPLIALPHRTGIEHRQSAVERLVAGIQNPIQGLALRAVPPPLDLHLGDGQLQRPLVADALIQRRGVELDAAGLGDLGGQRRGCDADPTRPKSELNNEVHSCDPASRCRR